MADQPINGLPKKTAAADTDALLMIGASEEYQIDYGKLADAILNKLTNKTFALDQGSKSLVAALNELNSKNVITLYTAFGKDLGEVIRQSGLLNGDRARVFICNKATNNPLGNGVIMLFYSAGYWIKHPNYVHITESRVTAGTLDCSNLSELKKDV